MLSKLLKEATVLPEANEEINHRNYISSLSYVDYAYAYVIRVQPYIEKRFIKFMPTYKFNKGEED